MLGNGFKKPLVKEKRIPMKHIMENKSLEDSNVHEVDSSNCISEDSALNPDINTTITKNHFMKDEIAINDTQFTQIPTINNIEKDTPESPLIFTPNKPIISKHMYDHIVKKLESIFDADPSVVGSKIILETTTHYSDQSETGRNPKIFDREISERTFTVECMSPIFKSFRNAFPEIKYDWIEKEVDSIKIANKMFMTQARLRKTDLLVTHLVDGKEIVDVEVSGPPYNPQESHTVGDIKKLLMMAVCNLCCIFGNDLNCKIEDAKKIKSFSIQEFRKKIMINTPEEDKMKVQDWLHFPDPSLKPLPDFLDAITI
ncbi:7811_t:CDS:2 [Entrophospora sp. SA101]|nr:7811_t:CDS:2 [Entrophospora sp. SA101]